VATDKGSLFDSLGSATPFGAAASVLGSAIATPNTSASGDINAGGATFGSVNVGAGAGSAGIPIYVWLIAGVLALAVILRK
jgi:hypothetical protein